MSKHASNACEATFLRAHGSDEMERCSIKAVSIPVTGWSWHVATLCYETREVDRFEQNPDPARFAWADAQRVLPRAYGFSSWAKLKQHVEDLNVETFCAAAESGDVVAVRKLAKARPELVNVQRAGKFAEIVALHFAVLNRDVAWRRLPLKVQTMCLKWLSHRIKVDEARGKCTVLASGR
jgi:hypothetical protein